MGMELVELPVPGAPRAGYVSIAVEFSPIIPIDFLLARGHYFEHPNCGR
jgi:NADPH:quinone reductase-like Zn-dependent oxidoreductase